MFLQAFVIKNFRSIESVALNFQKGVNVLIGENNAGKSAIIDALRICLSYGSSWRDISIDFSDFYVDRGTCDPPPCEIGFDLYFTITDPDEKGWFHDLYAITEEGYEDLQLHFRFHVEELNGNSKIRRRYWGGATEGQRPDPEVLDLFYYVYLEPLRDAVQHLKPIRGSKIGQLFLNIVTNPDKRKSLSGKVRSALNDDEEWKTVVDDGKGKINTHLLETTIRGKEQDVDLDFLPFEFKRIVENLQVRMPVFSNEVLAGDQTKQKYFDLYQNGLGYNNLIYTATILGHLKQKAEVDPTSYMALLIEEPEAHLHPQLQNILFNYLHTLNQEHFQVFISSHSPTITAKADLDSLIVLQHQGGKVTALPVLRSPLSPDNKRYLHKFLDVTKSQLFFANGVLLVEGISEALLLPIFSRMMGSEYDLDKAGVEIVNVNGVAFEHFGKLFNDPDQARRLAARCAIITDDDRGEPTDDESPRAANAVALENGSLKVFLGTVTFEYELFLQGNNKDILLGIFENLKPKAKRNIVAGPTLETHGRAFVQKVADNKAKSELAHQLAVELELTEATREGFVIPEYIKSAIRWVVKGE
ncbi:AAA family ATPase [Flavitalea sp. BT771]|uniref:ATP-dependent nuclease n=1 Tax=Flavitalea sp. BT771 TaxID=3063329 RepID=UPI0026E1A275|nr:AAA family ATPase [Flavitalea sp. BT771]MDO6433506.1 AAA family ATPase [Flavitalea sp. BT771]MDV6222589.1 AAA family ATPase [Flavitalea sp. BT771]